MFVQRSDSGCELVDPGPNLDEVIPDLSEAEIKERTTVPSAMPPGLGDVLGKRALRDVIEYLSTVK